MPGPVTTAEQLQPRFAQRRQRPRRSAVSREDVAARLQPARDGRADRQVPGRRAGRRARASRCSTTSACASASPSCSRRSKRTRSSPSAAGSRWSQLALGYVKQPLVSRRDDHRRDDDDAARGGHRRRAVRARRADARGDRGDPGALSRIRPVRIDHRRRPAAGPAVPAICPTTRRALSPRGSPTSACAPATG